MRSLFWRILASFWLAIALVAGLSILLGHMLNQDAWILSRHPGLNKLPEKWTNFTRNRVKSRAGVSAENANASITSTFRC